MQPNTEHTLNKNNPHDVTAEQVVSLKIYNSFSAINAKLGKEFNSTTPIADIIKAMPNNTGLVADIRDDALSVYPSTYGTLTIYKIREQRVSVMYKDWNRYVLWLGDYTEENGFKGFKRIITDKSEFSLTFENADLQRPIVMKNNNQYYAVEKHRLVDSRPCRMDVGLGSDPSAVMQIAIGEQGAEQAPDSYTQRLALMSDGVEFLSKSEDGKTTNRYKMFGQHNKPSRTYVGDGNTREIDTGGLGSLLLLWVDNEPKWFRLVTPHFSVIFSDSGSGIGGIGVTFNAGKLKITPEGITSANVAGKTYRYQVL